MRPILAPLFSPGILFNTIKSGIAVDYPVYTGSFEKVRYLHDASSLESDYYSVGIADGDMGKWHYRVNFEKLLDPSELVGIDFVDMEPHPSCSLNVTSSISIAPNKKNKYNLAINNFLASTVDFFMKDEELTSLVSQGEENYASVSSSKKYGLRIKMRRSTRGQKREDSSWPTPQEYISAGELLRHYQLDKFRYTIFLQISYLLTHYMDLMFLILRRIIMVSLGSILFIRLL